MVVVTVTVVLVAVSLTVAVMVYEVPRSQSPVSPSRKHSGKKGES